MANSKNVIELNGKRYDALTGKLIHGTPSPKTAVSRSESKPATAVAATPKKPAMKPASGRVQLVDGFIRNPHLRTKPAAPKPVHHAAAVAAPKPKKARPATHPAAPHKSRQQKAHTLMRHAVKKPALRDMVPTTAATPAVMPTPVNRISRADRIQKSSMISKFGSVAQANIVKKTESVPVKPAPVHAHHASAHITQRSNPIFDIALSQAAAVDEEKPHTHSKKTRLHHRAGARIGFNKKAVNIIMSAGVLLVLGGFFAYQNVPNLNLRVAAARAGVRATLPSYQPSGFGVAGIYAKPGQITIRFDGSGKEYSVTQTTSNWNSETLLQNQVATNNQAFQTFQDKGNTIYIYGDTNAAWVNGGILYEIKSGGNLTSDQLLKIAQSI